MTSHMIELIQELDKEHEYIEAEIISLRNFSSDDDFKKRLLSFLDYMKDHHGKEETKLFPWLAVQPWLSNGGPKCSFFMGMRIEFNQLESIKTTLETFKLKYLEFKIPQTVHPSWLQWGSPLNIPMEEHFLGIEVSAALLFILNDLDRKPPSSDNFYHRMLTSYLDLVSLHLKKEKECLFVLCKQKLGQ